MNNKKKAEHKDKSKQVFLEHKRMVRPFYPSLRHIFSFEYKVISHENYNESFVSCMSSEKMGGY